MSNQIYLRQVCDCKDSRKVRCNLGIISMNDIESRKAYGRIIKSIAGSLTSPLKQSWRESRVRRDEGHPCKGRPISRGPKREGGGGKRRREQMYLFTKRPLI